MKAPKEGRGMPQRGGGSYPPIHDSLAMEMAMRQLFGSDSKWSHSAGWFSDPRIFRKAILAATKRIRTRLREMVTADDRLLETTSISLNQIEREAKRLDARGTGVQDVVAHFVMLVANLLGYDWFTGSPNREVIYYQTRLQQDRDDLHRNSPDLHEEAKLESRITDDLVCSLYADGKRIPAIGRMMNMGDQRVRAILKKRGVPASGKNPGRPSR